MKTQKLLAGVSALALASIMTVTAFADTVINPDPDNMPNPTPDTAETTLELGIDPKYTVTIPAKVELSANTDGTYSGSGVISAANVKLVEGGKINVSLTSASKFNLQTAAASSTYKLPYTATGAFGELTNKTAGGKVAAFETPDVEGTDPSPVDVTFTTDVIPKYAGIYTDTVVFTISLEGV